MPQPYKGNGVGWGPNTVLDRPKLAPLIANICANWVLIEEDLNRIFSILVHLRHEEDGLRYNSLSGIGVQIIDTLNNFPPRLDLIERLLEWWKLDNELEKFRALRPKITARARERNTVAHGLWGIAANDELPEALILVQHDGAKSITYTSRDFEQISERILELDNELKKFHESLYDNFHS